MQQPDAQSQAVLRRLAVGGDARPAEMDDQAWVRRCRHRLRGLTLLAGDRPDLHEVRTLAAGTDGTTRQLRLYRPKDGVLPALLFLHGGGFVSGGLDTHDAACRQIAHDTGWLVAALDYRLAPEHPFPAAIEDGLAALRFLHARAPALGLDPDRLVVAGDSAGGLLAAVVAMLARERGGPTPRGQALFYPNADLRPQASHPSLHEQDGRVIRVEEMRRGIGLYLHGADPAGPLASPLLAPDLSGLPPALVAVCGCDPLRDEADAYAGRLRQAGVAVRLHRLDGTIHGALQMGGMLDAAATLRQALAGWLSDCCGASTGDPSASPLTPA